MRRLEEKIKAYSGPVTFESLKTFIDELDLDDLNYQQHIEKPKIEGDYGRNIITLDPFECVLIYWPTGVESAIHLHSGLFGYVWVLEGEIDNVCYRRNGKKLEEYEVQRYFRDGLIPEPDGVIHKITNASELHPAVTLHFYYPALRSLEDMLLFNIDELKTGVLSAEANTASWQEKEGHFKQVAENAFEFVGFDELNANKSHFISNVIPKPDSKRIGELNGAYFEEQAHQYDFHDHNHPVRKKYVDAIDHLIADDLSNTNVKSVLDIACGTGRRAIHIRGLSGLNYDITGVDISEKMCHIAETRGLTTHHQNWLENDDPSDERFDAATFLYAFGHISSRADRIRTLKKIHHYLNEKGRLYIDLFNMNNDNEWGPLAVEAYRMHNLRDYGYERGDVFYRKRGCTEIAFLHYFDFDQAQSMFEEAGFKIIDHKIVGYSVKPGEINLEDDNGNYFLIVEKV